MVYLWDLSIMIIMRMEGGSLAIKEQERVRILKRKLEILRMVIN